MKSIVALSYEFYNINKICRDLINTTKSFTLLKNTVGMLFCSAEVEDLQGLLSLLKEIYPFPIIGVTTMCSLNKDLNIQDVSVDLHILTADDCIFHIAKVPEVTYDNADEVIRKSYSETLKKLIDPPKVMFGFPPYTADIVLDKYTNIFSEMAEGVPFFGGVPSQFDLANDEIKTFSNDIIYNSGFVYMIIEGNINPIFAIGNEIAHTTSTISTITKAKDNIIYEVDDETFVDYFARMNMKLRRSKDNEGIDKHAFTTSPLVVFKNDHRRGQMQISTKAIKKINIEDGSGVTLSTIDEGVNFKLGYITTYDVKGSAEKTVQSICNKIKKAELDNSNYKYSTIFAISCVNRYLVMPLEHNIESEIIRNCDKYEVSGFYSSGEIAPLIVKGETFNETYSESIVLCAF